MVNEAFVDIHCHLVPAIDDGAASWDESLAMARMAAADGISTIVVTPHQLGSFRQNTGDAIRAGVAELQAFLNEHQVALRVLPGADVRIEPGLVAAIARGEVLSLADKRRHVLLELPHELYMPLGPLLKELSRAGLVGILSHPERNEGILDRPTVLQELVDNGCLLQVTAGSLLGAFGARVQQFSHWMVERRLVHFLATDAHGPTSRRPLLTQAYHRVASLADSELATRICCRNPARVAQGRNIDTAPAPSAAPIRRAGGWFTWKKAG